jgi:hypothetical protein
MVMVRPSWRYPIYAADSLAVKRTECRCCEAFGFVKMFSDAASAQAWEWPIVMLEPGDNNKNPDGRGMSLHVMGICDPALLCAARP